MSRIVFCEDEPRIRKLIQLSMRTTRHEVHLAADGVEGLEVTERLVPDAVFTDVGMPRMNGYDLADAIRSRPHLALVRLIFITASVQPSQRDEAARHGAVGLLAKPFSPEELRTKVDEFLAMAAGPAQAMAGPGSQDPATGA